MTKLGDIIAELESDPKGGGRDRADLLRALRCIDAMSRPRQPKVAEPDVPFFLPWGGDVKRDFINLARRVAWFAARDRTVSSTIDRARGLLHEHDGKWLRRLDESADESFNNPPDWDEP